MLASGFYQIDCMAAMQQFPDKFFDLAIVDPPYGIKIASHKNGKIVGGGQDHSVDKVGKVYASARSNLTRQNFTTPSTTTRRRTKVISTNWRGSRSTGSYGAVTS